MVTKARILVATAVAAVLLASPADATWPGRNGRIIFSGSVIDTANGCATIEPPDVYTMRPDGRGIEKLTDSPHAEADPVWAPEGNRVALTLIPNDGSDAQLRVMRSDGSASEQLATSRSDLGPSWSDHASWIAYTWTSAEYESDIRRVRADGSEREGVIATSADEFWPSYAPDGERIAYLRGRGNEGIDVWTVRPDGSRAKRLTHNVTFRRRRPRGYGNFSSLGWSPTGEWIIFTMNKGEGDSYVYKMRRSGAGLERLAPGRYAVWSPNGKRILYLTAGDGCGPDLYTMRTDGSAKRKVPLRDDLEIYSFDWGPR